MKKHIFRTAIIATLAVMTSSCWEDTLTLTPADALLDVDVFSSEENAEAALVYVYRSRSWWRFTSYLLEFYGDPEGTGSTSGPANASANQYWLKSITPDNGNADGHWRELWDHSSRANNFLHFIEDTPFRDPARKMAAIGEAKFMRAMYYHIMAMIWGRFPIIEELPAPLKPFRNSEEECYGFIIDELEFCIEHLPEENTGILRPGEWEARANKWAAKGLLAKVLMTAPEPLYDLDRALSLMDEIIGSGDFKLLDFYGDLMMVDNKDNPEGLFVVNHVNSSTVQDGSNAASLAVPSQIWYRPTWDFYHSFEEGDTRRDVNLLRLLITLPTGDTLRDDLYLGKLGYDERAINGFGWDNYPQYLVRYADILLLKAEALAKKNYTGNATEIFSLIEQVRNRAFQGQPHQVYGPSDFAGEEEFWKFLWWERKKELFYECHNFFDAKRMGLLTSMLGLQEYQYVLPISTYDLTLNPNLGQNPGY